MDHHCVICRSEQSCLASNMLRSCAVQVLQDCATYVLRSFQQHFMDAVHTPLVQSYADCHRRGYRSS